MTRRIRSTGSLKRRRPYIEPRASVLIVCEGEKTEPHYFEGLRRELRLTTVEVVVEGKDCGSAPKSVVAHAIELRKERVKDARRSSTLVKYDEVWCIIDVEAPQPHNTLDAAIDRARATNLNVALSNPCFEYWYILHFERTSALMKSKEAVKRLKQHHPKYKKNDPAFFEVVYPRTEAAIKNSKGVLKEKHCGDDLRDYNPSTHVHLIVERLQAISGRPE